MGDDGRSLRVTVVGDIHDDSFAENIARAAEEMGLATTAIDLRWDASRRGGRVGRVGRLAEDLVRRSAITRRALDRRVESALEIAEPDVVISTDGYVFPDQLERWRRYAPGARWALWYPDHLANLGSQRCFEAPWDGLFFKDPYLVDLLARWTSLPTHYLPEACLPSRHRSYEPATSEERATYRCDVAVAGHHYPYRLRILEQLPPAHLRLYGHAPGRSAGSALRAAYTGEYVTDRAKFLAFTEARIVLNTLHHAEIRSANTRLFEATACGGFVVSHGNAGVRELFRAGEEVVVVDSASELREAVVHYLADDQAEERQRIALAAQRRAHTEHTFASRIWALLGVLRDG